MIKDFLLALLGAVLALSLWGIQQRLERSRQRKRVKSAMAVEIATLVELMRQQNYASEFEAHAAHIKAAGVQFGYAILCIPITHSYFSVFEANAGLIGELDTKDVVRIVSFYQQARSLADSASKAGTPDNSITPVAEAASRYEALASSIEKLCNFGETLSRELTTKDVSDQIAEVATQLRPAD